MSKHAHIVRRGEEREREREREKKNYLMVYTTSVLMVAASAIAATFAPGGRP